MPKNGVWNKRIGVTLLDIGAYYAKVRRNYLNICWYQFCWKLALDGMTKTYIYSTYWKICSSFVRFVFNSSHRAEKKRRRLWTLTKRWQFCLQDCCLLWITFLDWLDFVLIQSWFFLFQQRLRHNFQKERCLPRRTETKKIGRVFLSCWKAISRFIFKCGDQCQKKLIPM